VLQNVRSESVLRHPDALEWLEERMGSSRAIQRLRIESEHEVRMAGRDGEGWSSCIRKTLGAVGLYDRGLKNAQGIQLKHHDVAARNLPTVFEGFTILHISDLHIDMNPGAIARLLEILDELKFDICVLTGDYRGKTFGPFDEAIEGLTLLRPSLGELVYGVLGNHDTARMVPAMEEIGVQTLLNESVVVERANQRFYLAGVDDAHFYKTDDIAKAASQIPSAHFSILLSHTPEIYERAADADFDLLLSGHTHGGQICLPGSFPITLCADLPRYMGAGAWKYRQILGYTSVGVGSSLVPVRFNCPPEIALHHLQVATGC
jgi:predicted MPP superfamily phosphohydrolase